MIFVRPYLRLLEGGIFQNLLPILFTFIAFSQAYRGVPVARKLWRKWQKLTSKPLTAVNKQLAEEAAFFVAVPISILIHEAGHAVAVLAFGGQVLEFGYFFFWGYVLPAGEFTAVQYWIIASAGTWGSLLFALGVWLAWRGSESRFAYYLMLRTVRFQIFYALIYYPLFTMVLQIGDWRTIYDFGQTPVLACITAVLHLFILGAHIWADWQGVYEMPAFDRKEDTAVLETLAAQVAAQPDDLALQARYIDTLRLGGATNRAKQHLRQTLRTHPHWAQGHLLRAVLKAHNKQRLPKSAVTDAQEALRLGLDQPLQRSMAHQILGDYALKTERYGEAEQHFSATIQELEREKDEHGRVSTLHLHGLAHAYYLRAGAYRAQRNYRTAQTDLQTAIRLAEQANHTKIAERYRQELTKTIQPYL